MDEKTKELISIGASVTANCVPCLEYHLAAARAVGLDNSEINEAISVGRLVRRGAARKWDEVASALARETLRPETEPGTACCGNRHAVA